MKTRSQYVLDLGQAVSLLDEYRSAIADGHNHNSAVEVSVCAVESAKGARSDARVILRRLVETLATTFTED